MFLLIFSLTNILFSLDELVENAAEQELECGRRAATLKKRKSELTIIDGVNESIEQVQMLDHGLCRIDFANGYLRPWLCWQRNSTSHINKLLLRRWSAFPVKSQKLLTALHPIISYRFRFFLQVHYESPFKAILAKLREQKPALQKEVDALHAEILKVPK